MRTNKRDKNVVALKRLVKYWKSKARDLEDELDYVKDILNKIQPDWEKVKDDESNKLD